MSERCELSVYQTFYYYRGRLIDEDFEPPSNFTDKFLDHLTAGLIHPGWSEERQQIITHACKAECALETVIIMGRPYTKDVKQAVDWLVLSSQKPTNLTLVKNDRACSF